MEENKPSAQKRSDDASSEEPPTVEAVETIRDSHNDFLGLAVTASEGDLEAFREEAADIRLALSEAETLLEDANNES
ncbi:MULTISPECIES: hypothetical protein [Halobacterium]|uniref:hypothetical protein n=1 Tax=Halobacterium TaxID=2239 RepID=UPI00073F0105|nr:MULTISPECIES: hypothetical protein [Halobacterium]MCG1002851.1 hypothetical protein [Halobacterium noricense]